MGENSGESCIPRGEGVGCVDGDSLPVLFDLMGEISVCCEKQMQRCAKRRGLRIAR